MEVEILKSGVTERRELSDHQLETSKVWWGLSICLSVFLSKMGPEGGVV